MKINILLIIISVVLIANLSCSRLPSGSPAAALVREGLSLFNTGKIDDSAIFFRQAYGLDPTYAPAYTMLGRVYLSNGDTYRAEMFFRKSLALDPSNTELYGWIGDIYWADKDTHKAFEYYSKCPEKDPHYAVLHYRLGMRAFQKGDNRSARSEFEKALTRKEYWGGHFGMGLMAFADGDYSASVKCFRSAACDSADPSFDYWMGKSYSRLGRKLEAYLCFKRCANKKRAEEELIKESFAMANELYEEEFASSDADIETTVVIPFSIAENSELRVGIYNLEGTQVRSLFEGWLTKGEYSMKWNGIDSEGKSCDPGIYIGYVDLPADIRLYRLFLSR